MFARVISENPGASIFSDALRLRTWRFSSSKLPKKTSILRLLCIRSTDHCDRRLKCPYPQFRHPSKPPLPCPARWQNIEPPCDGLGELAHCHPPPAPQPWHQLIGQALGEVDRTRHYGPLELVDAGVGALAE